MEENTNVEVNNQTPVPPQQQVKLPNSSGVLTLGILSIVFFCLCYGIISIALGIIALVLAGGAQKLYAQNPSQYTVGSYKNMKSGKVCAIIGLSLAGLIIVSVIVVIAVVGTSIFTMMPWEVLENLQY